MQGMENQHHFHVYEKSIQHEVQQEEMSVTTGSVYIWTNDSRAPQREQWLQHFQ
jgi:hypothetical protein